MEQNGKMPIHSFSPKSLGEQITLHRKALKIKQKELAVKIDVSTN